MALTPASVATRHTPYELHRWIVIPTIAAGTGIPTAAEVATGTEITEALASWSGFMKDAATVQAPDLAAREVPNVPGRVTLQDSSIVVWLDPLGADALTVFTVGTQTNICRFFDGLTTLGAMVTYVVRPIAITDGSGMEDVQTGTVNFALKKIYRSIKYVTP